ncbi:14206_t:CDS:2 [Entrophospora sp. SA101]|nr:14206_t:CDS:2 [Entrophospora sp. SA101]CAJ0901958.1 2142_t:CDS:2 [Entrophospora sp. SA101]
MKNLLQFLTLPKLLTVSIQNLKPNPNYTKLVVAILDIALSNHIDLALANSALSFLKTLPVSYQMILLELSLYAPVAYEFCGKIHDYCITLLRELPIIKNDMVTTIYKSVVSGSKAKFYFYKVLEIVVQVTSYLAINSLYVDLV